MLGFFFVRTRVVLPKQFREQYPINGNGQCFMNGLETVGRAFKDLWKL